MRVDPRYFRPTEVETLLGDPTKARQKLGWTAEVGFTRAGGGDGAADWTPSAMPWSRKRAIKVYSHHE